MFDYMVSVFLQQCDFDKSEVISEMTRFIVQPECCEKT